MKSGFFRVLKFTISGWEYKGNGSISGESMISLILFIESVFLGNLERLPARFLEEPSKGIWFSKLLRALFLVPIVFLSYSFLSSSLICPIWNEGFYLIVA